ncbi:transglutaminase domain-containing protein [Pseudenhygromyxa sp. WMMC2535]|uniref:transglutaminase domain-containing protein n=1 Tax=Pseudenhygromyxa sp. WMMC2535 TaxID=2712867 RepID=UPI001551E618|nr:transglutaminase domain-containing protein [Pseudenhygromyxa sp. WMMC2535]
MSAPRFAPAARARLLAPLLLLTLGACSSVPNGHEPGDDPAQSSASQDEGATHIERVLAISIAGQPVGYVETTLDKHPDGTWTNAERVTFSMIRQGGGDDAQFSSTTESTSVYDPAHEFVSETEIEREAGITITRSLTLEGREFVSSYTGPSRDTPEIKRFPLPEDYRSSLAVDFELVEEFERTGQPATRRFASFDAERERFERSELTLLGREDFEHGGQIIPAWRFRAVEEDGTVIESLTDADFMPLMLEAGGTFLASLVDAPPVLDPSALGKIDSELPVLGKTAPNWWMLASQEVTVTVEGDDPELPPLWEDGHYHAVERDGSRYTMTLLSTRPPADFEHPQLPLSVDDPELRKYLAPTAMAQSDDPAIVSVARQLAGDETDALVVADRIIAAVFSGIDKQAGMRGSATASEVLQNAAGDCTEHAVLVVALMRAAGIPARAVDGIVLAADRSGQGVAGYHAWAEIWVGEWIGVDATVGETGTSARYLLFGVDEPGTLGAGGKMMRTIGKTKIELGAHQLLSDD